MTENDNIQQLMVRHNFYLHKQQKCKDCATQRTVYIYKHALKNHMLWITPTENGGGTVAQFIDNEGKDVYRLDQLVKFMLDNYPHGS
jgi:hypothetical protein